MSLNHVKCAVLLTIISATGSCGAKSKSSAGPTPPPKTDETTKPADGAAKLNPAAGPAALSFAADVQPVLALACSGCHSPGSQFPPAFVGDETAFRKNGDLILASLKLADPAKRMPAHRAPLTADQQKTLETFLASPTGSAKAAPAPTSPFAQTVQPILEKNCGACHTAGSNFAPIFVGDEAAFRKNSDAILASVVQTDAALRMPYSAARPALSDTDLKVLKDFLGK